MSCAVRFATSKSALCGDQNTDEQPGLRASRQQFCFEGLPFVQLALTGVPVEREHILPRALQVHFGCRSAQPLPLSPGSGACTCVERVRSTFQFCAGMHSVGE